jgi:hypothetical protein
VPSVGGSPGSNAHTNNALKDALGDTKWQHPRPSGKFKWNTYLLPEANDWAEKVDALLTALEATRGAVLQGGGGYLTALKEDAASLSTGSDASTAAYVKRVLEAEAAGIHESCLVDTWVGDTSQPSHIQ